MSFPKTIVLTTLPNKLPIIKTTTNDLLQSDRCNVSILLDSQMKRKDSYSSESDISPAPIRKRQRLDHLSSEEKMLRRKLKNRVAAQCARDRKKAKMMSLEDQVIELEREKKALMKENFILKQHNQQLERENKELKQRLSLQETENSTSEKDTKLPIKKEDSCESFEYASLISVPLQKEQDLQHRTVLMMQFVCLLMIVKLMTFLTFYKSAVKNCYKITSLLPPLQKKQTKEPIQKENPMIKWWGPHQQNWNPSKNW